MSAPNVPDIQVAVDSETYVVLKVTAYYNASTVAANTLILQANTLKGANANIVPCMLDLERIEYGVGTSNGFINFEYVSSTGANSNIMNFGKHHGSGVYTQYIPNNATSPTGDIGMYTSALDANDSFQFVMTLRKRNDSTNAWAAIWNAYNHTPGTGG